MTYRDTDFFVGQIVWVGPVGDPLHKVTWRILSLNQAEPGRIYAVIRSGQSERSATVPVSRLTPFRLVERETA